MAPKSVQGDAAVRIAAKLLIAVLVCSFLYLAKVVLIPCGLALLISFMLQPVVRRLRRWRLPRLLAVILTVMLFGSVLGGMSVLIGGQLAAFAAELPDYRAEMVSKITEARDALRGGTIAKLQTTFSSVAAEVKKDENATTPETPKTEPMPVTIASPDKFLDMGGVSAIGPLLEPLATGGLVALLVVLMLLQWAELRSRLVGFLPSNVTGATQALDDAAQRIGRYLGMQLLVNASFGLVAGLGFYFLGVRYAALWGLCAGLFRYVPYAGPVVGALLPLSVSLLTSQGWSQFLAVGALLLVLELINDNLVEPFVYGSSVGISEIGIILAAVAWTVLWGPAGLVLATPLTVCLVVLGEHVPALSFFARLLGDKPVLSPHYLFYERLLARDDVEAAEMVKRLATEDPEAAVAEVLVVPALAFARREQSLRRLSPAQAADAIERALRMVPPSANGSEAEAKPAAPPPSAVPVILWSVCPFGDAAQDYLAARLDGLPCTVEPVRSNELIGHALSRLSTLDRPAAALAVVELHSGDDDRVRGLLKRVRAAFPALPMVVARWNGHRSDSDETAALIKSGATTVTQSLGQTRDWLASLIVEESCKYPVIDQGGQAFQAVRAPPVREIRNPKPEIRNKFK